MAESALARIELCRDLLILNQRGKVSPDSPPSVQRNARILVGNRISAIRRILLDRPRTPVVDDLLSPSIGRKKLLSILNEAKDKPESERVAIGAYANEISKILSQIETGEQLARVGDKPSISHFELQEAIADLYGGNTTPETDLLVDDSIQRGKFSEEFRDEIASASATADNNKSVAGESIKRIEQVNPALAAQHEEVRRKSDELIEHVRDLKARAEEAFGAARRGHGDESLVDIAQALKDEFDAAYAEYNRHFEKEYKVISEQVTEALRSARESLSAPFEKIGKSAIADLMASSSITEQEAEAWAKAQEITTAARNRLKKIGYAPEQVVSDMAEFYRLTGGRITSVKIHSKGDKRANANDIAAHGKVGQVNIDGAFNRRVLWHELAHHIEADPVARMAAGRLIKRRSVDGVAYSLRSLTGNGGYRKDEIAYKDGFFSEYIGKIYRDGMTEVFSMGVESLSNPSLLGQRMAQDPQTLEFVTGFLKAPVNPLAKALMGLREGMREMNDGAVEDKESSIDDMINRLAARGDTLVDCTDEDKAFIAAHRMGWMLQNRKWEAVARFSDSQSTFLFAGKVKRHSTGRQCSGLIVARFLSESGLDTTPFDTTDKTIILAASAGYRKNGVWPRSYELQNEDYLKKALE